MHAGAATQPRPETAGPILLNSNENPYGPSPKALAAIAAANSLANRYPDDAEDAMQEALIKTYRYVGRIREPGAFRPWLYRTVRNACLMGRRKKVGEPARLQSLDDVLPRHHGPTRPDAPDPGKNPEQLADNTGLRRRLRAALRRLPASYRAIVFLREMEGLSTREVAQVMGISEDNVKTRLYRARVQLQADLGSGTK